MKKTGKILILLLVLTMLVTSLQATGNKKVRVFYLVPSEKTENPNYVSGVASKIRHIQQWYSEQLGHQYTFNLYSKDVVEVLVSPHSSEWFTKNPTSQWTPFYRSIEDVASIINVPNKPDEELWMIYADITLPKDESVRVGGGYLGITVMGPPDLKGLSGNTNFARWVGGSAHELGHAFGLPHTNESHKYTCPKNKDCLMEIGYLKYPNNILVDGEKKVLRESGYFTHTSTETKPNAVSDLSTDNIEKHQVSVYFKDNSKNEMGFKIFLNGLVVKKLPKAEGAKKQNFLLTGLKSNTRYRVNIHPYNSAGLGARGKTLFFKTKANGTIETKPNAVSDLSTDNIEKHQVSVYFKDNSKNEMGFKIFLNGLVVKKLPKAEGAKKQNFLLTELKSNTRYRVNIHPYNSAGLGARGKTLFFKTH